MSVWPGRMTYTWFASTGMPSSTWCNRHSGVLREDLGHQAFAVGRQVLDEHERHPWLVGHSLEEFDERLQPARRCADPDDRKRQPRSFFRANRLGLPVMLFRRLLVRLLLGLALKPFSFSMKIWRQPFSNPQKKRPSRPPPFEK